VENVGECEEMLVLMTWEVEQGSFEGGDWNQNFAKFWKKEMYQEMYQDSWMSWMCHDVS